MSRVKYDMSRVPRELLERFASYQLCLYDKQPSINGNDIVKAAEVPLRTKAEVDADIIDLVRSYHKWFMTSAPGHLTPYYNSSFRYKDKNVQVNELLAKLNEEETSD